MVIPCSTFNKLRNAETKKLKLIGWSGKCELFFAISLVSVSIVDELSEEKFSLFDAFGIVLIIKKIASLVRNALSFLVERNGWRRVTLPTMALACAATLSSTLFLHNSVTLTCQSSGTTLGSSFLSGRENSSVVPLLLVCHAKKKLSFMDQILDYIEGGPKLRKWYGAPDILEKDSTSIEDDGDGYPEDEVRDAVLVTDGDSEIGQMVILSLIVKKTRVKALVKNKRVALEAFGSYVESLAGDRSDNRFLKKALRGVRTIICPNEGFLSSVGSLQGVQHVILLSQLSVYSGKSGFQSMMKNNVKKLAEQDESVLKSSGIPYTIIRTGALQDTPGGKQGFTFDKGVADSGSISKEDAAFVCVAALDCVPQNGFIFEVANGDKRVSDWKECLATLMEKAS
ncbi:hypothetical protein RJT34_17290 [Clitoria ternatea]|uniref:NAD(P)-binding domain-containing protein n=1 Tax=Clitoria ternatea TaxID=43366 RepID=A0AAN9JA13_CLITE